jgi:hypothetical protein
MNISKNLSIYSQKYVNIPVLANPRQNRNNFLSETFILFRAAAGAGQLGSFMNLRGPSRAIKFLYAPAPLPPHSMYGP